MNKIIGLTGSPESAYSTFLYVVQNMFSWENGRGKPLVLDSVRHAVGIIVDSCNIDHLGYR